MAELAPIVLFTYKRLDTLIKTVEALQKNNLSADSNLFIFSDAAKTDNDKQAIDKVRNYIKSIVGFKKIIIHEALHNKGLADSIIEGVTNVVNQFEKVIVLEDDIVVADNFLKYMNEALDYYHKDKKVMQVSAFMFPIDSQDLPDTFFYAANTCWGWATWSRAWQYFIPETSMIIKELKENRISWDEFNSSQGKEFQKQLFKNHSGKLKTWAVKWHSSIILNKGTVLHPKSTYVKNIGFDGVGENCQKGDSLGDLNHDLNLNISDAMYYSNSIALERLRKYFLKRYSLFEKVRRKIKHYTK